MSRNQELERKERDRKFRRQIFYGATLTFLALLACALVWSLRGLILPIVVGALLAYLFRPLRDRFQVSWLSHEMRLLALFMVLGSLIFMGITRVRKHLPTERQKLELKVRLKYKLNEKFQQFAGKGGSPDNPLVKLILEDAAPIMDQVNHFLELSSDEQELFMKYRMGYNGEAPIADRFFDFYQANMTTMSYVHPAQPRGPATVAPTVEAGEPAPRSGEVKKRGRMEDLSVWLLAPIVFLFLGLDNGQLRRYFVGLVPNRYFELSLTVLDHLDEAIGKYLRGTVLECTLVGLTISIGMLILGIPFSVSILVGTISGLANAIPFLGTVIGLVIGMAYVLIAEDVQPVLPFLNQNDLPIYYLVLMVVAHLLDNAVFQPFVLGNAVNLHPLVVAIAIMAGSLIGGIWGMLFAIPAIVVLKTTVETMFRELKAYRII